MIGQDFLCFVCATLALVVSGIVIIVYVTLPYIVTRYVIDRRAPSAERLPKPDAFNLSSETVTFVTSDGLALSGWWISNQSEQGTIIIAHGRGSHKAALLNQAVLFIDLGYNVLLIDLRAHGDSEGRWVTAGRREADDLLSAATFLQQHKQPVGPIVLYGFSLGARAALFAAAHRPDIAGVIAIAPSPCLESWINRQFERRVGLSAPPGFYRCFAALARLRSGIFYSRTLLDLTSRSADIGPLPVLLMCGEHDWISTPDDVRRIQAVVAQAEVVIIANADHIGVFYADPCRHKQALITFLERATSLFLKKY